MKKSDVLKTFRKINEATTDGYIPSENTHLVNKQYVDDNKLPIEVLKITSIDTNNHKIYIDSAQLEPYKKYIIDYNAITDINLGYYYSIILTKTLSDGTIKELGSVGNFVSSITTASKDTLFNTMSIYVEASGRIYTFLLGTGDKDSTADLISKGFTVSTNNVVEYTPTGNYNPATKKYVDDIAETLVMKDTNKYKLITCDDPLVIAKSDITDIADATVTIDNLTGQFGNLVANEDGTWTYTLNTIMTDVETFTFKVNDTEQKLVIVPYKEMIYDDKNTGITYEGNWYEDTNDNYYKKSSHYTKGTDNSVSKLSFIFTGTAVKFVGMTSKALGKNHIRNQIFIVNSDGSIGSVSSYAAVSDNSINSTDDVLYNTSLIYSNIYDKLGYGKYKTVLVSGKGDSTYIDRIIIYNTIQNLNDAIESLYNQKESTSTVLRIDIPNKVYQPKGFYDPATKKYVDDLVNSNKINMCTDEEFDSMLTSKLVISEDNDDLVFLQTLTE